FSCVRRAPNSRSRADRRGAPGVAAISTRRFRITAVRNAGPASPAIAAKAGASKPRRGKNRWRTEVLRAATVFPPALPPRTQQTGGRRRAARGIKAEKEKRRMTAYAFALFDTAFGRAGLAWGAGGLRAVSFPSRDEAKVRARLLARAP